MNKIKIFILIIPILLSSCFDNSEKPKEGLLIYCGITMVKPITKLAKEFEEKHNVKINITQGGSQNLYNSLKTSKIGDLYIPGSDSYRKNNYKDGLLEDYKLLGYNRLSLIVKKDNPLGINNDLNNLTNEKYKVVLGDKDFGSVGMASYKLLNMLGIREKVYNNAVYLTTDSRRITEAIKKDEADLTLNWYAVSFWKNNKEFLEAIELPKNIAIPKKIEINLLSFSKNKDLAKKFIDFASSNYGKKIFYNYGFWTKKEYLEFNENK